MPEIQFRFRIYGEPGALSAEYPEMGFRILANLPTEAGLLVILEAVMENTAAFDRYLTEENAPSDWTVLHADAQRVVMQMICDYAQPPPYRAVRESGILFQYPLDLRNGWVTADLTTSHERLSRLQDTFETAGLAYEVLAIRQSTEPTSLLTDRQREFVTEAVERGYYESPRECTLTDLAAAMDVTKGAASGTLHRAERRIIKTFLGEPAV